MSFFHHNISKLKYRLIVISSYYFDNRIGPWMRFNFYIARWQKRVNFLLEGWYFFAFTTVDWESWLFSEIHRWCQGDTYNIMIFAVNSEKQRLFFIAMKFTLTWQMLDLINDVKIIISQWVQGEYSIRMDNA